MFPKQIQLWTAMRGDEVVAGVLVFCCPNVWHAQYIASSPTGYEVCALDSLFESIVGQANSQGVRYFDFGTSTESAGTVLNEGLYHFKSGFGGGGVVHEFYTFSL
jgi:lipid II:glycine glycyltransferase (peptidoglycan interpeptide bridge formation enzyme)